MKDNTTKTPSYGGFEQGPIRPPSEAASLLIRVTRNCPWNRCSFCPVYKGQTFSLRPVNHVLKDIDTINRYVQLIREHAGQSGRVSRSDIAALSGRTEPGERAALNAALHWTMNGMRSIFLQDANSLIIKPERLLTILGHLKDCFPWVERITSYARSHTIARISDADLRLMAEAGLNRIHIGMESGSDKVLAMVGKGVDKATHIQAGLKVKKAGMELSEYVMPGLGGKALSREHALETADALNRINPDFIRLRTLAIPNHIQLFQDVSLGNFEKQTDREISGEILLFLESLEGITSTLKSDHILNLFEDIEGVFPQDKQRMTDVVRTFLALPATEQVLYQVGRRIGLFSRLDDLHISDRRAEAEATCTRLGITIDNVDSIIDEMMKRFI
jgi:radical SAM superfamily enzyme YgiQ (UPF0313 family)